MSMKGSAGIMVKSQGMPDTLGPPKQALHITVPMLCLSGIQLAAAKQGQTRRVRQGPRVASAPESRATYAPGRSSNMKAPTFCTPTPSDAAAKACPACVHHGQR